MAYAKMNIGMVAGYQGLKDRELQYYIEAKELFSSIRDSSGLADATLNIGTMYHENGAYKYALENFTLRDQKSIINLAQFEANIWAKDKGCNYKK